VQQGATPLLLEGPTATNATPAAIPTKGSPLPVHPVLKEAMLMIRVLKISYPDLQFQFSTIWFHLNEKNL
jgi:hypothetical protein